MFFKWIIKLFVALNANSRPFQIAAGIAIAFLIALIPSWSPFGFVIFVITFFLKVNNAVILVSVPLFGFLTPLLDGLCNAVGILLLGLPALQEFFTMLYNLPIIPLTAFNNSLVLGALVVGIVAFVPVLLFFIFLIIYYRRFVRDKIAKSKFMKTFKNVPVIAQLVKAIAGAQAQFVG